MVRVLLYGHRGWIGDKLCKLLEEKEVCTIKMDTRIENYEKVCRDLDIVEPTHVILAAGLTGRPNVDQLEEIHEQVIKVNVLAAANMASECKSRSIHFSFYSTGCIYEYDQDHPIGGKGFTEEDPPNFRGSFYSRTKIMAEDIIKNYDNSLIFRLRMPLTPDLHPRNFITKITTYEYVVDIPNSMTVLDDMLPYSLDMIFRNIVGVYNFTNPGTISHNQILTMYKQYIDPGFTWKNFSEEEQSKILKAGRSNNKLDVTKLVRLYPSVPHIKHSVKNLFKRMVLNLQLTRLSLDSYFKYNLMLEKKKAVVPNYHMINDTDVRSPIDLLSSPSSESSLNSSTGSFIETLIESTENGDNLEEQTK